MNTVNTADVTRDTTLLAPRSAALLWIQEADDLHRQLELAGCTRLAERVIDWARRNNDLELLGRGLLMRGKLHYGQDRNLDAALDLQEALRLCKAHAAPEYQAEALTFSGALAHICGDTVRAVALGRAALACLPQLPEFAQRRQDFLLGLSLTLQERSGEYVEATHCCSDLLPPPPSPLSGSSGTNRKAKPRS